ncbi:superoxide dismutase family protein [Herminiimonas sp.]|uniref:superoxide dismutase family protein n=1 Tax=Herminiimonas sp. TaxID=1926289 RepID=UPI00271615A6|nr:superoxide dismutase family protein [Herminiimonas sp.]MDO8306471.1 superoxide dismutase family protein [Herminiimonas sp.]
MNIIPVATLLSAVAVLASCAGFSESRPAAEAIMKPTQGNTTSGVVSFVQKGDQVVVNAQISGLTPGLHGFHIHEKGDCSAPDATSAGGHFNPAGKRHGGPAHAEHHGGDFGNLLADASGKASLTITVSSSQASLARDGANSIIGKGLIVHADPDDYATQPTGNAGKRLACGVITLK